MALTRVTVLTFMILAAALPARAMELVTVYAAASTQPVIDALIPVMEQRDLAISAVYAGSATLARQIELGASADVFITANEQWMDYLAERELLEPATYRDIATNRLVLISHQPLAAPLMVFGPGYPLAAVLGDGRLAIGSPDFVPAGRYAKEALTAIGAWDQVKDRLAPTKDVTGALMLVARGEARLGVVYRSDVRRTSDVQLFQTFSGDSHSPIVYQAAITKDNATDGLRGFLDVLSGPEGQAAFLAAGFGAKP